MCTNTRWIYNPHAKRKVLVNCGHCPACLQDKADARASRIRNNVDSAHTNLFVTLTYKNEYVPTVRRSDIDVSKDLQIFRYASPFAKDKGKHNIPLGSVYVSYLPYGFDVKYLRVPRNYRYGDNIAVPFYKDVQDFFKRLRINLARSNYDFQFKYYSCLEIGPTSHRPHFHLLLSVPKGHEQIFRSYIVKSWPFADKNRTADFIKIAFSASTYVASYVNSDSHLPKFFQTSYFKQKHSYSKDYGISSAEFSIPSIFEKINEGNLRLYKPSTLSPFGINTVLFPKYVINRYFPQFKGYNRFSTGSLLEFYQRITKLESVINKSDYDRRKLREKSDELKQETLLTFQGSCYTLSDIHKIQVSLYNHANKFCNVLNSKRNIIFSFSDYFRLFDKCWRVYNSSKMRNFYESMESVLYRYPYMCHYDNISDINNFILNTSLPFTSNDYPILQNCGISCDYNIFQPSKISIYENPNSLPLRVMATQASESRYYRLFKRRKNTNLIMSTMELDV